ncbi:MAG TPA: hypothetical protein VFQ97_06485 [Gallionella sp.]|nr:hypothetical protein [Gallionella sp.]
MTNKLRLNIAAAIAAMFLSTYAASLLAADLPMLTSVSMQVQPQVAEIMGGQVLTLEVDTTGINGLGVQTPVSIIGAPDGTKVDVTAITGQRANVSLVFPQAVASGKYELLVKIGDPAPLVEQQVELTIKE